MMMYIYGYFLLGFLVGLLTIYAINPLDTEPSKEDEEVNTAAGILALCLFLWPVIVIIFGFMNFTELLCKGVFQLKKEQARRKTARKMLDEINSGS